MYKSDCIPHVDSIMIRYQLSEYNSCADLMMIISKKHVNLNLRSQYQIGWLPKRSFWKFVPTKMIQILFIILSLSCIALQFTFAANILYLCALPSPSHFVWYPFFTFTCFQKLLPLFSLFCNLETSVNLIYTAFHNFQFSFDFIHRNSALANGLAARGHNVTVVSPDIDKNPPKGVHYIHLEGIYSDEYLALAKNL